MHPMVVITATARLPELWLPHAESVILLYLHMFLSSGERSGGENLDASSTSTLVRPTTLAATVSPLTILSDREVL